MYYVPIQKDFSRIKNKVILGLTKRQLLCFGLAGLCGIPTYLMLKERVATDIAGIVMILVMLPFFLFAMYEKDGMYLEEILRLYVREKYLRPMIRPVKNEPILMGIEQITAYKKWQEEVRKTKEEKFIKRKIMKGDERRWKRKSFERIKTEKR